MSLRHRLGALGALLQHYKAVFSHHWQHRQHLTPPTLQAHEAEFLPAALSLQHQPVSPMGRWVGRILMLLIVVLLLWSILGRIDIVVNAQGKIVPSSRTKTITSAEVANVRSLHVEEGQAVKAGDLLIELDTRASESERDKAAITKQTAMLQAARSRAMIAALNSGREPYLAPPVATESMTRQQWEDAQQHLIGQWRDFEAKRQRLDAEIQRYNATLPLATQQARDFADLASTHDVAQHAWLDKEQARLDMQGQLNDVRHQRAALIAETRRTAEDTLNEANRVMSEAAQDQRRASVHGEALRLLTPVDGTVQQLAVHTIGAAVPAAQPLMQIVPTDGPVEVEATLENKDIGFVQEGQAAQVKIDTFEYTKYGTVPAHVSHVSRDAIQDEKRGLIYTVKVRLDKTMMVVDGREMRLSAGMAANVEIKTGSRRAIEYVLSPLLQHGRESLNER